MQLVFSIHGMRRPPHKLPDRHIEQSAVAMLPGGGELVIASDSTILQFYDAHKDRHIDKVQVDIPIFHEATLNPVPLIETLDGPARPLVPLLSVSIPAIEISLL